MAAIDQGKGSRKQGKDKSRLLAIDSFVSLLFPFYLIYCGKIIFPEKPEKN